MTEQRNPENSPYFSHWRYDGNWLQRTLKAGPRTPLFNQMTADETKVFNDAARDNDEYSSAALMLYPGERNAAKTLTALQWTEAYANSNDLSLYALYQQSSWAYRCCEILAQSLVAIPWTVYKQDGETPDDDIVEWLNDVNPETDWHSLAYATMNDRNIYGMAFWHKIRDGNRMQFIERISPENIQVNYDYTSKEFRFIPSVGASIPRDDMVYFRTYNPRDDTQGISPTTIARRAIETEIYADRHLAAFFKNGAKADGYFSLPTVNTAEINRARQDWQRWHGDPDNAHRTGFVGASAEHKDMGYAPKDLALEIVRAEARRKICAAYGVPETMAGSTEAANYATADVQRKFLYQANIIPNADYMAGVINSDLIWKEFGADRNFAFKYDNLSVLQEDTTEKAKRVTWLVNSGILKREKAATEMGYEETDVPEEAPRASAPMDIVEDAPPPAKMEIDDIKLWRRKSIKRVKAGKSAQCAFNSVEIPDVLNQSIYGLLGAAKTEQDVDGIFDDAEGWAGYP